ncbi:MAG TPA: ATP-binding protein, partial [Allosphingosinicella sp.]|nr:ATP-binding protein [Allosphingosinicella sp.]
RDPTAKAVRRSNYTRTNDRTKSWELKPECEWVLMSVEAVVSEELWARCNAGLDGNAARRTPAARRPVHLFAGYAFCHCGTKMYVWTGSPKYVCTSCRNKIPANDLEEVYREQLRNFLLSPEDLEAHRRAADDEIRETERLIAAARVELQKLETEDDRLYQLYLADSLSKEDFGRRHRPLSERRTQFEDELPRLQARLDVLAIGTASQAEALEEARDLWSRWETLPLEDKRQIVETITDRIIVGRDDVEIRLLHIPFGSSAGKATRSCRCGHLGDPALACSRAPRCAADYQAKVSGPLLDRIDIHVEVAAVAAADLVLPPPSEGSTEVARRVAGARSVQTARYAAHGVRTNAEADGDLLDAVATPEEPGRRLLAQAAEAMRLSARGYHRVMRVGRTIADLAGSETVGRVHVAEALSYRRLMPRN